MTIKNKMKIEFLSKSENESFSRVVIAAFISQLDPTIEELTEIKTALSEAVTNSIIHGYEKEEGLVSISCIIYDDNNLEIIIEDNGIGINDINKAREPLYTSKPEFERSGMGFTVMETFMDEVTVNSRINEGTIITMRKKIGNLNN